MWTFLLFSLAVLLPLTNAQDDGSIGDCNAETVVGFFTQLSIRPGACAGALRDVAYANVTTEVYNAALQRLCTVDCGGTVAKWSAVSCGAGGFKTAIGILLYCLPRETGNDRCRSTFPDLIDPALVLSLGSCLNFTNECPANCTNALTWGRMALGCCYQSIYNDTDIVLGFEAQGLLQTSDLQIIEAVSNPWLWAACNVSLTSVCEGPPFPGGFRGLLSARAVIVR